MKILFQWFALLCIAVLCTKILPLFPEWIDNYYVPYFYNNYHLVLHFLWGKFPFSVGDILYAVCILYILIRIYKIGTSKENRITKTITFFLQICTCFFIVFNLSWGLNNYRTPLHQKLNLDLSYTTSDLEHITALLILRVNESHIGLGNAVQEKVEIANQRDSFHLHAVEGFEKISSEFELPQFPMEMAKVSLYSKILTKMGFSGYFNPFTHEAQVNNEIPTISLPVTTAHEMAHQLGIAKESEANFIAFQVMLAQSNKSYQYAAYLYALKYCLKEWRLRDPEKFDFYEAQLHTGVLRNIKESEAFWIQNKNFSSVFFKKVYGRFLKINNQKDGMRSYNKFVDLLIHYEKKHPLS